MRLLKIQDDGQFSLVEFSGDDIPPYAILSHTWGADSEEVTFKDIVKGKGKSKTGYEKIQFCGKQAAKDGLQYFWVDTCCIDKTSSSELSEAINSMFNWYARSECCYAYLVDVHTVSDIERSRWFTRGWTLQELIAPTDVQFYSTRWTLLGRKSSILLENVLLEVLGIPKQRGHALIHYRAQDWTIAERMSWASKRVTKRVEDMAYCLLGIFEVNMPLLYGEGERAFIRLQEEIMKKSEDHSLFAWRDDGLMRGSFCGLLARSPTSFADSNLLPSRIWSPNSDLFHESTSQTPYSMTNQGIYIQLRLLPMASGDPSLYFAILGYSMFSKTAVAVILKRFGQHQFARTRPDLILTRNALSQGNYSLMDRILDGFGVAKTETISVMQPAPVIKLQNHSKDPMFWVEFSQILNAGFDLSLYPPGDRGATNPSLPREIDLIHHSSKSIILIPNQAKTRTLYFPHVFGNEFKLIIDRTGSCELKALHAELPFFLLNSTSMHPKSAKLIMVIDEIYEKFLVVSAHSTVESVENVHSIVLDARILNTFTSMSDQVVIKVLVWCSVAGCLSLVVQLLWRYMSRRNRVKTSFSSISTLFTILSRYLRTGSR
jgi:hypothetical protein